MFFLPCALVHAHNLDQRFTQIVLDPETVDVMRARAQAGEPPIQVGDVIGMILKSTPGPGTDTGVGGYLTFYLPDQSTFLVVGAEYLAPDPDRPGYYKAVPMKGQSIIAIGDGPIGAKVTTELKGFSYPSANVLGVNEAPVDATSGLARGTIAGVYADTGIFYSTDSRTAWQSWEDSARTYNGVTGSPFPLYLTNNRGETIKPNTIWDAEQLIAYGVKNPISPIIDYSDGRGNTPWGLGNGVAGPESGYAWDFRLSLYAENGGDSNKTVAMRAAIQGDALTDEYPFGPWNRIKYPGSQISKDQAGLDSTELGYAGIDASNLGYDLDIGHPLPEETNAVRFSFGMLELGRTEVARVYLEVKEPFSTCPFPVVGDAFGGDAGGEQGGKDHLWRYYDPTDATLDFCGGLQKRASKTLVVSGETVEITLTYFNASGTPTANLVVTDALPSGLTYVGGSAVPAPASTSPLTWNIGYVPPYGMVDITFSVTASGSGDLFNTAVATSDQGIHTATESIRVGLYSLLEWEKSVTPSAVAPGDTVTYTIEVQNVGTGPNSTPLVIRDFLPDGFSYTSMVSKTINGAPLATSQFSVDASDPTIPVFTISQAIQAGQSLILKFRVVVDSETESGTYYNTFSMSYGGKTVASGPVAPVIVGGGRIGDTIYRDWDGDGTQDAGEEGISGVTVSLYNDVNGNGVYDDGTDTLITTDVTDTNGKYLFEGLTAGDYVVVVNTGATGLVDHTNTADPDGAPADEAGVALGFNEGRQDIDFGYKPSGSAAIQGNVYDDSTGGTPNDLDGTDTDIDAVTVDLYEDTNGNGVIDDGDLLLETTSSDSNGYYEFTGLAGGLDYIVDIDADDPDLTSHFSPYVYGTVTGADSVDPRPVADLSGTVTEDFGYVPIIPCAIGDQVYFDADESGTYNEGDSPLPGITVNLYESDGTTLIASTTTAVDGTYSFTGLLAGSYVVKVDTADEDIPGNYGASVSQYSPVTLTAGETNNDIDFPFIEVPSPLSKAVNLERASTGDTLTYTLTPEYIGNDLLTNVQVSDATPAGSAYVGSSASPTPTSAPADGEGGTITWNLGSTDAAVDGHATLSDGVVSGIAQRGSSTLSSIASSTTLVIDRPTQPDASVAGDVLIAQIAWSNGDNATSVSSSGWTAIDNVKYDDGGQKRRMCVLYKLAGGSEPDTYTFTFNGTGQTVNGAITAFSGVDSSIFDVAPGTINTGDSSTPTDASITTVTANAAVIMFAASMDGDTGAAAANYSDWTTADKGDLGNELYDYNLQEKNPIGAAWAAKSAGTTGNGTVTFVASKKWGALLIALKPGNTITYEYDTTTSLSASRSMVKTGDSITVNLTVTTSTVSGSPDYPFTVTAGSLTVTGTNGASATFGAASPLTQQLTAEGSAIFTYTSTSVTAGSSPGLLTFKATPSDDKNGSWAEGTANTVIATPAFTYQVTVGSPALSTDPAVNGENTLSDSVTATISHVATTTASVRGGTSLSPAKPTGTQSGDVMIAALSLSLEGGSTVITPPSGWTLIRRTNSGTDHGQAAYYKVAGSSEPANYTWGASPADRWSISISSYRGVDTSDPVDVDAAQATGGDTTSVVAPGVTTTVANAMLVGIFTTEAGAEDGSTFSPPTGMTERADVNTQDGGGNEAGLEVADVTSAGPGATGDKVATAVEGVDSKEGIGHLIALKPGFTSTYDYDTVTALSATAGPVESGDTIVVTVTLTATGTGVPSSISAPTLNISSLYGASATFGAPSPSGPLALESDEPVEFTYTSTSVTATSVDDILTFTATPSDANGSWAEGTANTVIVLADEDASVRTDIRNTAQITSESGITPSNSNEVVTQIDSSIGDYVWSDVNGDGLQAGESGIAGVRVYVDSNTNGQYDSGEPSAVTDATGYYRIYGFSADTYPVRYDPATIPAGYTATTPVLHSAIVAANTDYNDADFGLRPPGDSSIGDLVWLDFNEDGVYDAGSDQPIANVDVKLYQDNGDVGTYEEGTDVLLFTDTTDANGNYLFDGLYAGNYLVLVDETDPDFPSGADLVDDSPAQPNPEAVTLGSAEDNLDIDFAYNYTGSIGDLVWFDSNLDGAEGPGLDEVGFEDAVVLLYVDANANGHIDSGDSHVATTFTDADGNYLFDNLPPGTYFVIVDTQTLSTPGATAAWFTWIATTPIDAGGSGGVIRTATLTAGQVRTDVDFGFAQRALVGDTVFHDVNHNGIQDNGEPGIPNITVTLSGTDIDGNPVDLTTTTDANGNYQFLVLPGKYTVSVDTADTDIPDAFGDTPTTPASYTQTVVLGDELEDFDFGFDNTGSIGDLVFADMGTTGVYVDPATDPGIANVVVELYLDDGDGLFDPLNDSLVAVTSTDADGKYLFPGLADGTYFVNVWSDSLPLAYDTTPTYESGATPVLDGVYKATITSGSTDVDADFGYPLAPPGSITGTVYLDDGGTPKDFDGTDGTLAGVRIELYDGNGDLVATTVTDANGFYRFDGLRAGTYSVVEIDPDSATSVRDIDDPATDLDFNKISVDVTGGSTADDNNFLDEIGDTDYLADITGQVRNDIDANGVLTDAEDGINGNTIRLFADTDGDGLVTLYNVVDGLIDIDGSGGTPDTADDGTLFGFTIIDGAVDVNGDGAITTADDGTDLINGLNVIDGKLDIVEGGGITTDDDGTIGDEPLVATTTTATISTVDGSYEFGPNASSAMNLVFGDYIVVETDVTGAESTADVDGANDNQIGVALSFGGSSDNDFLDTQLYTIDGRVYHDVNGNGQFDIGTDIPLQYVGVLITDATGAISIVYTDADGNWTAEVPPGETTANVLNADPNAGSATEQGVANYFPNGYVQTDGTDPTTLNVIADNTDFGDDGYFDTSGTASIAGTVYSDTYPDPTDNNIIDPANDTPVPGVILSLYLDLNNNHLIDTLPVIDGYLDLSGDGLRVDDVGYTSGDDDGTVNGVAIIDGGVDLNGDGTIDGDDDGTFLGYTVVDGRLDLSGNGTVDTDDDGTVITEPLVAVTVTDSNGDYSFTGLAYGSYVVAETDPAGAYSENEAAGAGASVGASTIDNQIGVTLTSGGVTSSTDNNFLDDNVGLYTISGTVYDDTDGDEAFSGGDSPQTGTTVTLYRDINGNGIVDPEDVLLDSTTTDGNGDYSFTGYPNGDYVVVQTDPDKRSSVTDSDGNGTNGPNAVGLTVAGADSTGNDFLDSPYASISGTVVNDTNNNGVWDTSEPGLNGVVVRLVVDSNGNGLADPEETVFATTTTNVNGDYAFTDIPAGNYVVVESDPTGYNSTADVVGLNDNQIGVVAVGTVTDRDFLDHQPVPTTAVIAAVRVLLIDVMPVVEWTTASEVQTAAFRVWRLDRGRADAEPVDPEWMPALGTAQGAVYRIPDPLPVPGSPVHYLIEELMSTGSILFHGPYVARVPDVSRAAASDDELFMAAGRPGVTRRVAAQPDDRGENARGRGRGKGAKTEASGTLSVAVRAGGMYYVSSATIAAELGKPVSDIRRSIMKRSLALLCQGETCTYIPAKGNAGLYFYGEALRTPYTETNVYTLVDGHGSGRPPVHVYHGDAPAKTVATSFRHTVHVEKNNQASPEIVKNPDEDLWFWGPLMPTIPSLSSRTVAVALPDLSTAEHPADIAVRLVGGTDTAAAVDHVAELAVNGTVIGRTEWDGQNAVMLKGTVSSSLLNAAANSVMVNVLLAPNVSFSMCQLDYVEVTYNRELRAGASGRLDFNAERWAQVTIEGFPSPDIAVYELSDPLAPAQVGRVTISGDGPYSVTFVAPATAPYVAVVPEAVQTLTPVLHTPAIDLTDRANEADYVIVTIPALQTGAEQLAAYRAAQGLATMVVMVEDVFNAFSGGVYHPPAIRDFLEYADRKWRRPPRYAVLVGDGTYDYMDRAMRHDNLVPPMLVGTPFGVFGSDVNFGDFDDDGAPEIAVGRLPVLTAAELDQTIAKLVAAENAGSDPWATDILLLADVPDAGGDFVADSNGLGDSVPGSLTQQRIYLTELALPDARTALQSLLSQGVRLVNYAGHGGLDRLDSDGLLISADVSALDNAPQLPILTAATCVIGRFSVPGYDALGEVLVLDPDGGTTAVWAPSALAYHAQSMPMVQRFYEAVFSERAERVGDAVLEALAVPPPDIPGLEDNRIDGRKWFNLIGDPAQKFFIRPR